MFNIDCMEFMADKPDKFYDLAIVDPPYGIGEDGKRNASRGKLAKPKIYKPYQNGDVVPSKEYWDALRRVSKNQIIWGANYFISNIPFDSSCWIVWDKDNGKNDFADCELAYTSFSSSVRKFRFRWSGMLQGDMKNKQRRIHPNEKPIQLYEWLLVNYAKPGDKILDTHGGSGSICIACHDLGFDLDWCELDADYFESAKKRFEIYKRNAPTGLGLEKTITKNKDSLNSLLSI